MCGTVDRCVDVQRCNRRDRRVLAAARATPQLATAAAPRQRSFAVGGGVLRSSDPSFDAKSQPNLSLGSSAQSSSSSRTRGASDVADAHVNALNRSQRLSAVKYGVNSSWVSDAYVLAHNAIKRQLLSLYEIVESIASRAHLLNEAELDQFAVWWQTFEAFVTEYFDFEADVLMNWANADARVMAELKDSCLGQIRQLCGTFELRRYVDATDLFFTIVREVDAMVPKLLHYFSALHAHLSPLIRATHVPKDVVALTKLYVAYIKKGENPHVHLVLLTRWMDAATKEKWVRTYIRGLSRLLFRRWERHCVRSYVSIVTAFRKRAMREARKTAASRIRRRTEFGEDVDEISFGSIPSQAGSIRSLNLAKAKMRKNGSRSTGRLGV
ncbi:hypothetical protein FGB62_3g227 [Gracilaria domingensis]|nr:hypothetical protein FGB62_3g227 [Gracilaria domingensis]